MTTYRTDLAAMATNKRVYAISTAIFYTWRKVGSVDELKIYGWPAVFAPPIIPDPWVDIRAAAEAYSLTLPDDLTGEAVGSLVMTMYRAHLMLTYTSNDEREISTAGSGSHVGPLEIPPVSLPARQFPCESPSGYHAVVFDLLASTPGNAAETWPFTYMQFQPGVPYTASPTEITVAALQYDDRLALPFYSTYGHRSIDPSYGSSGGRRRLIREASQAVTQPVVPVMPATPSGATAADLALIVNSVNVLTANVELVSTQVFALATRIEEVAGLVAAASVGETDSERIRQAVIQLAQVHDEVRTAVLEVLAKSKQIPTETQRRVELALVGAASLLR